MFPLRILEMPSPRRVVKQPSGFFKDHQSSHLLSLWFEWNDNTWEAQTGATADSADCRLAECKMEVFSIFNQYWFTWYLPLVTLQHTRTAKICVRARKDASRLNISGDGIVKNTSCLKIQCGWIWGLSHSACCLARKSLRGLNLNRAFGNTDCGVALEHRKLISLCCLTVWVVSPRWHARALPNPPGGFERGPGGGGGGGG